MEPKISAIFLLCLLVLCGLSGRALSNDEDLATELLNMQDRSPDGIIHLDDASLLRFAAIPKSRPYALLIFFDALQMRDNSDLRLGELRQEFQLTASTFIHTNINTNNRKKLFFCDIEFKESQASFSLFGVNSLPHIRHVAPGNTPLKNTDIMPYEGNSRAAENIAAFVESKTGLRVGQIQRPPPVSRNQFIFIGVVLLASAPFVMKKVLLKRDTPFHDPKVWLAGAIFVYFFSVSGGMYNIIRKMPLFMADRNDASKVVFFLQGSGMQLGVEGFAVGFLYSMVGLLLALVTHLLVYVRNQNVQRLVMMVGMIVSFFAVKKVISLDNWKTGYTVYGFWPSSWN